MRSDYPPQGLVDYILKTKPHTLLLADRGQDFLYKAIVDQNPGPGVTRVTLDELPAAIESHGRFDLVLFSNSLELLPKKDAVRLLSKIRDLYTENLIVLYTNESKDAENAANRLQRHDFCSLGFKTAEKIAMDPDSVLYEYGIKDYKTVPDWLNSRFWANPQNWGKYRW